jgi:hypothetical protein
LATLLTAYSLRNPCRFYFAPAALLGFTLRSFLLSQGIRSVSGRMNPLTVHFPIYPTPTCVGMGPARETAVSGLPPLRRVPDGPRVFSTRTAGCSPGFMPPGVCRENLDQDFARPPLTRFPAAPYDAAAASQRLDRPSRLLILPRRKTAKAWRSNPFRLSAPLTS